MCNSCSNDFEEVRIVLERVEHTFVVEPKLWKEWVLLTRKQQILPKAALESAIRGWIAKARKEDEKRHD